IGLCQTHSLYSPMREFRCHQQAVAAAQAFLDGLMEERELSEDERVNEELLGKVMRGEETPEIDLNDFAEIESAEADSKAQNIRDELTAKPAKKITRRNILRGNFG
ncbi:MAG: [NiFe]-hydrogenase assembly chaperone HybE, partial [Gammaproteobacteria bacterium]|nr:[NiFe]-hydrogenase assembly chaperone HybE [Gammaproteobacteria bacterium]